MSTKSIGTEPVTFTVNTNFPQVLICFNGASWSYPIAGAPIFEFVTDMERAIIKAMLESTLRELERGE